MSCSHSCSALLSNILVVVLWLPGTEQVLEAQMKADMADKEMLESSQSKYEEEVREKCSIISEQKAVRTDQLGNSTISGVF